MNQLFGIILILGKPKSRGTLRLRSADATQRAQIDPAYYSDAEELETMVRGVRIARRSGAPAGSRTGARGAATGQAQALGQGDRALRQKNTITTYHFAGTCAMGAREADAVDTELRVRGIHGVRVADASAIPVPRVGAQRAEHAHRLSLREDARRARMKRVTRAQRVTWRTVREA